MATSASIRSEDLQLDQIAKLKHQLATTGEQLERAQSFVFDLRCAVARRNGKGLWVREKDKSGMRSAIWGEKDGLGASAWIRVSLRTLSIRFSLVAYCRSRC